MKQVLSILSILTIPFIAHAINIRDKASMLDYKMQDISGKEISINDIKEQNGFAVVFSCNTCPWVIDWEDRYNEVAQTAKKNKIGIVFVNSNERQRNDKDSLDAMKEHATKMGYDFYYAVDKDNQLADSMDAKKTPDVFLFNSANELVYKGAIDDNAKDAKKVTQTYFKDALNSLGHNEPIKVTSTKSFGCSIKRIN
jgi:hypothetical protein